MANYKIVSHGGSGLPLNVYGSGTITSRRNVCIWTDTGSTDQQWAIASLGSNQQVKSLNNLNYMLNANTSTWNCDVYTSNADTYINFILVSTGVYRLQYTRSRLVLKRVELSQSQPLQVILGSMAIPINSPIKAIGMPMKILIRIS